MDVTDTLTSSSSRQPAIVAFDLELRDHKALAAHVCAPAKGSKRLAQLGVVAGVGVAAVVAHRFVQSTTSFLLGMIATSLMLIAATRALMSAAAAQRAPSSGGSILCHYELALTEAGVAITTPLWQSVHKWEGVIAVEETAEHIFLKIDPTAAYTVPKRAFPHPEAARAFVQAAELHCLRARLPQLPS